MKIVPCYQFAKFLNIHGPYSLQIRLKSCTNSGDQAVNSSTQISHLQNGVSLHHRGMRSMNQNTFQAGRAFEEKGT